MARQTRVPAAVRNSRAAQKTVATTAPTAPAVAAGANPTKAEYDVAVAAVNAMRTALITAGILK